MNRETFPASIERPPRMLAVFVPVALAACILMTGCAPAGEKKQAAPSPATASRLQVLAVQSVLADLARNVAGERADVSTLIPLGLDPHAFEPTPQDIRRISESTVLVVNGAGMESWLDPVLKNAGGSRLLVEASKGLKFREQHADEKAAHGEKHDHENDPHFWFDPVSVLSYVENIRDGLSQADPAGKDLFARNAAAYSGRLRELDGWISGEVGALPEKRRLLVTNHESFGYFADRYGFEVVGAVIPSVSTGSSPSAREMKDLIGAIRKTGAPAVFLETGANAGLAGQLARETGIKVVTGLYTHSLSEASGPVPDYLALMKHNTKVIVNALK